MLYIAAYDIENNNLRTKIAELLQTAGLERVQYSVFVGPLTESKRQGLLKKVEKMLGQRSNANLLLFLLDANALQPKAHLGDAPPDWEYLKGKLQTLIL